MNIKASYKYQLADHIKSIVIFYGVILAILLLTMVTITGTGESSDGSLGGMDISTAIFLFVAGLCAFKEPFLMLMQNGVSRKSIFLSRIYTSLTVSLFMALLDKVIYSIGKAIAALNSHFRFSALYEMVYNKTAAHENTFLLQTNILILDFLTCVTFVSVGYLIAILFYRMNKAGKIAIGAGVPVGLFVVLPILDSALFNYSIVSTVTRFVDFAFGLSTANPYAAMITFAVSSALLWALTWLMLRKAVVKA